MQVMKAEDYINKIRAEIPYVDIKPYSHNIISICLRALSNLGWSHEQIGEFIKEEGLDAMGW